MIEWWLGSFWLMAFSLPGWLQWSQDLSVSLSCPTGMNQLHNQINLSQSRSKSIPNSQPYLYSAGMQDSHKSLGKQYIKCLATLFLPPSASSHTHPQREGDLSHTQNKQIAGFTSVRMAWIKKILWLKEENIVFLFIMFSSVQLFHFHSHCRCL